MFDTEIAAAQPSPRLWFVTRFPSSSLIWIEDESSDWIMVRVWAGRKDVPAHFDGAVILYICVRLKKR